MVPPSANVDEFASEVDLDAVRGHDAEPAELVNAPVDGVALFVTVAGQWC